MATLMTHLVRAARVNNLACHFQVTICYGVKGPTQDSNTRALLDWRKVKLWLNTWWNTKWQPREINSVLAVKRRSVKAGNEREQIECDVDEPSVKKSTWSRLARIPCSLTYFTSCVSAGSRSAFLKIVSSSFIELALHFVFETPCLKVKVDRTTKSRGGPTAQPPALVVVAGWFCAESPFLFPFFPGAAAAAAASFSSAKWPSTLLAFGPPAAVPPPFESFVRFAGIMMDDATRTGSCSPPASKRTQLLHSVKRGTICLQRQCSRHTASKKHCLLTTD